MTTADFYARIGSAIRARRAEVGLTQAVLASETGLSRSSITNIENGGQAILLHQFADLARALRIDSSNLLALVGDECEPEVEVALERNGVRATDLLARLTPMTEVER